MDITREFSCNVLQRYFAKKMLKVYRFPRDLEMEIAQEMGCSVSIVHMVLSVNCYEAA